MTVQPLVIWIGSLRMGKIRSLIKRSMFYQRQCYFEWWTALFKRTELEHHWVFYTSDKIECAFYSCSLHGFRRFPRARVFDTPSRVGHSPIFPCLLDQFFWKTLPVYSPKVLLHWKLMEFSSSSFLTKADSSCALVCAAATVQQTDKRVR